MTDQETREAGDVGCIRSDINVLKIMASQYEEQGGGHSQKEALNTAIKFLSSLAAIKGNGVLPEIIDAKDGNADVWESGYETGKWEGQYEYKDKTAVKLAKFLSGLEEELYNLVYGVFYLKDPFFAREDEAAQVAEITSKAITDHIKKEMGVSE